MISKTKSGKIISDGTQAFNVPKTDEGLAFIKALRKFSNQKQHNEFTVRGRGSRKEYAKVGGRFSAQSFVPHEYAEWFAVYMNANAAAKEILISKLYAEQQKLRDENKNLKDEVTPPMVSDYDILAKENANLKKENANLKKESVTLQDIGERYAREIGFLRITINRINNGKTVAPVAPVTPIMPKAPVTPVVPVVTPVVPVAVSDVTMGAITIMVPLGTKINVVQK